MYIAMNRFKVMKGAESAFEHVWLSRDTHLDRVPGFLEFHLLRGPERDDHVLYSSHTVWASKDAFTAWTQSEHFRAAHRDAGANKPLYLGHPEFEGFEVLQTIKNPNARMRPPEGGHANLPLPFLRSARRKRIPLCRRTESAARAGRLGQRRRMGGLFVVQQQSERLGARDLAASDLHGNVRDDARHGDQRRHRQRGAGEARALSSFRLPTGGVDRGRPLAFTFDGAPHVGFAGDSIASALLANGVSIVGRSFKYHRPRGIWGAWTEEPNAIVDVTRNGADDPEPPRDHRGARERPRRAFGQCGADGGRRSRRSHRQARAGAAGGLLLQDFLMAALGDLRRPDPRHGRPRPRRSEQSPAGRQSADQRALRSSCRRRRPGGSRRGGGRRPRGTGRVPGRRPCRDRRPARPSRRRDRRRRLAGLGAETSCAPSRPPADG